MATATDKAARPDIYTTVTNRIVEQLEAGTRPWLKPWNAEHAAGRIIEPWLRSNGYLN
ncbi:MAG TPA: ArdC-like ssDNA-binding domain-containing protein [Pirellulales bacterium]|nr:ArdC-like ssDNA-binding domain-containing protein [Pirellulales bacterium]